MWGRATALHACKVVASSCGPDSNFGLVQKTKWPPYHMFNVKRGYPITKGHISPQILLLEVQNVKTTCRKSWPGNLVQMLNLTSASRLNEIVRLKCPYFSLIIGAMASDCKDRP